MAFLQKFVSKSPRLNGYLRRYKTTSTIIFSDEVQQAKVKNLPIVALESTIITHGMPYPQNLETAGQVENIIRNQGAVPATIAILKGQLNVGLTQDQLQYLAQAKGVVKASRRDLAPIIAAKLDGATTVAGTIIAAELADIPIFVTGGIGGVHRDGESTLDVSADLNELGRSRTLVVCSGVKSILDIGRTLEYLETQGVCVCAFGETNDFPAFYTRRSGHKAPHRVANAAEAASVLHASRDLGLSSGIVVAVPVPKEQAMDESKIEEAIHKALVDAKQKNIQGKEVTPFILAAVAKATTGASLNTNIALIKNNAKVGASIAVQYKNIEKDSLGALNIGFGLGKSSGPRRHFHTSCERRAGLSNKPLFDASFADGNVLVIGGSNVDRTYRTTEDVHLDGSTHPCKTEQCGGGVGRNIAEALWRLRDGRARLLTAVGDDADGRYLADIAPGLLLDGCIIKDGRTSTYAAVLDPRGECLLGLGDMALHDCISPDMVNRHIPVLEQAPLVVIDGNLPEATIQHVLQVCQRKQKPVFFEPTDRRKAIKPLKTQMTLNFSSPNMNELRAMANYIGPICDDKTGNEFNNLIELAKIVSKSVEFNIITLGKKGILTVKTQCSSTMVRFYPATVIEHIENVSGAGDCFIAGFIAGMLKNNEESVNISIGFQSANYALLSNNTVPTNLHFNNILVKAADFEPIKINL